jgi:hypothetical protein
MIIGDYEIIDHDIEHSDYFPGCGTFRTNYDHVDTGIGANFAEAYDDCCEMIAQRRDIDSGFWEEFDKRVLKDIRRSAFPKRPAVGARHNESCYYHVSIRYNLKENGMI